MSSSCVLEPIEENKKINTLELMEKSKSFDSNWKLVISDVEWEYFTTKFFVDLDDKTKIEITTSRAQGISKLDKENMIENFVKMIPVGSYTSCRRISCIAPSFYESIFWALFWAYVHEFSGYGIKRSIDLFRSMCKKNGRKIKFSESSDWTKKGEINFDVSNTA